MASKREWPLWHATSDMTEEEKNEAIDRFLEWRFPNRKEAPRSQDQSDTDVAIFERVLRNSSGRAVATETNITLDKMVAVCGEAEWAAIQTVHVDDSVALEC